MRISTSMLHNQGLAAMQRQQSQLAQTQNQLSSNQKWFSASDDPVGFGTAEGLDRQLAQIARYQSNAETANHRLLIEEDALAEGIDVLQRARELTLQANSAGQSDQSRAVIAIELNALREQLLGVANRDDGQGRYIFAGSADGVAPFSWNGSAANYAGDQQVRSAQLGATRMVAEGDAGDAVFMGQRSGNGTFAVNAATTNTGGAQLAAAKVVDVSAWDNASYTVQFNAGNYEVRDSGNAVVQSGSYSAGSAISFRGIELSFSGTPANTDTYTVSPSQSQDVLALIDKLARLVATPQNDAGQRGQWQTALQQGLTELDAAQAHFSDLRATVGVRLAAAEDASGQLGAQKLHAQEALSDVRDLDYAEAATRLQMQLTALQAAQQTYTRVQGLSLFDYLR
ncbi:MAG: flagellar hook-associated protein FlgL [Pseudomonadota bacterium]|nr:flagellar hook-associated protein FlgL [Pseudomonadota bacterium]